MEQLQYPAAESCAAPVDHDRASSARLMKTIPNSTAISSVAGTTARQYTLPFRVRIVRNGEQLTRAVEIRAQAYSKHIPTLGEILARPEQDDLDTSALVFLAESKKTGDSLGTLRVQTNFDHPLPIEQYAPLPEEYHQLPMAEVSRLAVRAGNSGNLVKLALFKALHRYCLAKQIQCIVIGARPPLDRDYMALGFKDVFPDKQLRVLGSTGGIAHRILSADLIDSERAWIEARHPLYDFMSRRFHPDIEIFASVSNMWTQPRASSDTNRRAADPIRADVNLPGKHND